MTETQYSEHKQLNITWSNNPFKLKYKNTSYKFVISFFTFLPMMASAFNQNKKCPYDIHRLHIYKYELYCRHTWSNLTTKSIHVDSIKKVKFSLITHKTENQLFNSKF